MLSAPLAAAIINKYVWKSNKEQYLRLEIISRYGTRVTCIAGAVISSISIFCSSYATSLSALLVSYGVFGGDSEFCRQAGLKGFHSRKNCDMK